MRLSARDAAVTTLALILSSVLIYLYVQERGRSSARTDEKPLGTIVFKKLNATRRLRNKLVWERIRNDSPVYEADTLRTADSSEATVRFSDGIDLDMYENTMLRLVFTGKEKRLEFLGGNISISSAKRGAAGPTSAGPAEGVSASAYTISAGGKTIALAEASSATVSRNGDALSVDVVSGEAAVTREDGTVETVDRGKALEINLETGATTTVERAILPRFPEPNARLLYEGAAAAGIAFSWETSGDTGSANGGEAAVEVAQDKDFKTAVRSVQAAGNAAELELEGGAWYWRIRGAEGTFSAPRRFALYVEEPPRPILPENGSEVSFRSAPPAVRFSWTRMENATAYLFEIASDPDFAEPRRRDRTSLEGITVADLAEGTWYWRVTPLYAMTLVGTSEKREARSLTIRRRPEMAPLAAAVPAQDARFVVQEVAEKGIAFSWSPTVEAAEYELRISPTSDMEAAVVTLASDRPWLTLAGNDAQTLKAPGKWTWAVRWKDRDGDFSPYSAPRRLEGIDGSIAVKLSFPPDGYTIADSLIGSTRFAWKSKLQADAVFRLSSDPGFADTVWEARSEADTLIGRPWKSGTWYWRIETLNPDGSLLHATPPRSFRVVDPLPPPRLVAPIPENDLYLRGEDGGAFRWEEVHGADYYQFELRSLSEGGAESRRYAATLEDRSIELPLGSYPEGKYRVLLQAFARDKETSTRLIGYLGRSDFTLVHLSRSRLEAPPDGAALDGLEARRHGVGLVWTAGPENGETELLVSKEGDFRSPFLRRKVASGEFSIPRLPAGNYYWTVKSSAFGLDLSAARGNAFSVLPIPPLGAPELRSPLPGTRLGPAELRGLSSLRFEWEAVAGANRYDFAVYRGSAAAPVLSASALSHPFFELDDFTVLDAGEYRWTVTARSFDDGGAMEQDGTAASSSFRIELPPLHAPAPKGKEKFYGR